MYQLKIIVASTRPERKGPLIAEWFHSLMKPYSEFTVEVLDLKQINLPFLDEPEHPMLKRYHHDHTKKWSDTIGSADAFIVVTAEYNGGFPAPLKNAIDFLYSEWAYKPAGLVTYGGVSAGTRSGLSLRQVLTAVKLVPLAEAVSIPFFTRYINVDKVFVGDDALVSSAHIMIKELIRWTKALKPMRVPAQ